MRAYCEMPLSSHFCWHDRLQDTWDESHWKSLNKSLHRVSCTTDGKYDSMKEIKVSLQCFLIQLLCVWKF